MQEKECIFCKIISGEIEGKKVWENDSFLTIENKYPDYPIHLLVIPKAHKEKSELMTVEKQQFWADIMSAVSETIISQGLDKKGYKLVINGAGYNHIDHEHIHLMSGIPEEKR
jgi:histidine triad (HIT) family protein